MGTSSTTDILANLNVSLWELEVTSLRLTVLHRAGNSLFDFLSWQETLHPKDRDYVVNTFLDLINGKRPSFDCQFRLMNRDGDWVTYRMRGAPLRESEEQGFSRIGGVLEDFSVHDNKVAELHRRIAKLEVQAKEKNDFFASITHELRTPMTGVLGLADILLDAPELTDDHRSLIQSIRQCGTSLLTLINDTLDLSKLEARKLILVPSTFDIRVFVRDIEALFSGRFLQKKHTFVAVVDDDVPSYVSVDRVRLQQILVNLIGNAQKFTPDGGGICLRIEKARSSARSANLLFSVVDSGIGIKNENQEKIFAEYTQETDTTGVHFGGTGLGLSIARELVSLHGGDLKVRSEQGRGTVFQFAIDVDTVERLVTSSALESTLPQRQLRILLAEDNLVNQKVASRMLEKNGHTVVIAENGKDALELHEKESFDLILMDIQMPVMSGDQAARLIREREQQGSVTPVPIIALTAHAMSGDREKYLSLGMDGYVSKPIDRKALFEAIHTATSST